MKANFFKRILAYSLDYIIISILLFIIFSINGNYSNNMKNELSDTLDSVYSGELSEEEYIDEIFITNYNTQKASIFENSMSVLVVVGYYIVFAYLNNGQTIGKKIFKIKICENDNKPSIKGLIIRSIFIYGIITNMFNIIFVNFLSVNKFGYGNVILSYIDISILIISFLMILYKKDGRGLHDVIAHTYVIEEKER